MKKAIILLLLSLSVAAVQAQNCDSIAQSIVAKINGYSPDDLLPYYDKESDTWGLMSKKGKILTQPLDFFAWGIVFNSNARFYYDNCEITINGKNYTYETREIIRALIAGMEPYVDADINPNIKGFKVEKEENSTYYRVSEHSNLYKDVFNQFKYNEKWYAYAKLAENNILGVIDEDGNIVIDFKYKSLNFIENYKDKSQCWFYFENEEGKRGFINTNGETKLYGELFSYVTNATYNVQKNKEKSGILDLRTLEWTIKPQEKLKFESIISIGQDTENQTYYVVVADGDEKYIIDMNKKAYKPKK